MRPRPISADALDYQPASYLDNPGIRRYRVASLCVSAALRRGWSGDSRCFGFILKSFRTPACNDAFTAHAGRGPLSRGDSRAPGRAHLSGAAAYVSGRMADVEHRGWLDPRHLLRPLPPAPYGPDRHQPHGG